MAAFDAHSETEKAMLSDVLVFLVVIMGTGSLCFGGNARTEFGVAQILSSMFVRFSHPCTLSGYSEACDA